MGRCCIQIVMGPAGSGKSTYCYAIQEHCATIGRVRGRAVHVANLDPAAGEEFKYGVAFDIRDLISVDEVMDELHLGPNGALVYCMEYLLDNMDWLQDELDKFDDDEYVIFDCPGQLELYTHIPVMRRIVDQLRMWGYESSMAGVFVVDATFVCDAPKFISGSLLSLSAMIAMELPHVNVLSKCDLVDKEQVERVLDVESAIQLWSIEEHAEDAEAGTTALASGGLRVVDPYDLNATPSQTHGEGEMERLAPEDIALQRRRRRRNRLTEAICSLLDDYSMVGFLPLDITDEDSIDVVLAQVDHMIQYDENLEVKEFESEPAEAGEDG